ncbi:hypothetical protein ABXT63_02660 [Candidatus Pelagibacter sp. Uisw_092]|uniref:hypothetical protein n=1 Tax=Candidatus Pelagibacter sp. Uisw_092 TaxID=3230979 RepID=UPI0039E7D746
MKKKIVVLGSTGSIGKTFLNIIKKDIYNNEIYLLSINKNIKELSNQLKFFRVKNIIINDKKSFIKIKKKFRNKKINIYNNFNCFGKIFKNIKIDYTLNAISGLAGLKPTLEIIRHSKKIAIANKESIICGWPLIKKNLVKYKTKFIPINFRTFFNMGFAQQYKPKKYRKGFYYSIRWAF